jgi:hypothetical protein
MHITHTIYFNNALFKWKVLLYQGKYMNAIALQEPVSKLKGSFTDCALPGKPFIWLPFAGGISAFAVILPKPMGTSHGVGGGYPDTSNVNGCYAETLDRKAGSNFGSL